MWKLRYSEAKETRDVGQDSAAVTTVTPGPELESLRSQCKAWTHTYTHKHTQIRVRVMCCTLEKCVTLHCTLTVTQTDLSLPLSLSLSLSLSLAVSSFDSIFTLQNCKTLQNATLVVLSTKSRPACKIKSKCQMQRALQNCIRILDLILWISATAV